MTEPYLILHKVRGEAAFDIAIRIQIGDEEGWIIPTSGHRAYPFWHHSLKMLCIEFFLDGGIGYGHTQLDHRIPEMPPGLPDHYAINTPPPSPPPPRRHIATIDDLLI